MIPMPQQLPHDDLSRLNELIQRFAHWRQNRPSPKARIPKELWHDAVSLTLTSNLSVSRVAKELGLCSSDLKKHCPASASLPRTGTPNPPIHFVDVTPSSAWLSPTVEVDLKRLDGAQLHVAYYGESSQVADVVRCFLEPR